MLRVIFICVFLMPVAAFANISLSPFFIELDATSRDRTGQVRFTNTSNVPQTYKVKMVNFKQEADGSYTLINDAIADSQFAEPYLEWSPRVVTLQPNQAQVVRIQRQSMAGAGDGEYVSHLLIQEQDTGQSDMAPKKSDGLAIQLTALYGVSIPVMIENGNLWATADIESVRVLDRGAGPIARVNVARFGTRSFYGTLVVRNGRNEYGRIEKFRIFTDTPNRVIDVPLSSYPPRGTDVVLIDEKTNETLETMRI